MEHHFLILRRRTDGVLASELIDGATADYLPSADFSDLDVEIIDSSPVDFSAVTNNESAATRHTADVLNALLALDTIPEREAEIRRTIERVYALGVNAGLRIANVARVPEWW